DHREIGFFHQPRLDRGVILHRAMAVQMIRRDIQKYAGGRVKGGSKIDLEGRAFDDMNALLGGRRQCENRRADVAADFDRKTEAPEKMRGERRRRGFSIRSGDRHESRGRCDLPPLAAKQFHVTDNFNPALPSARSSEAMDGSTERREKAPANQNSASPRPRDFRS